RSSGRDARGLPWPLLLTADDDRVNARRSRARREPRAPRDSSRSVDGTHRRLLRLVSLAVLFEGFGRSLVVITLPYVGADLHATPAELSYALALISVGSLGVLLLGPIADRFGRPPLLLPSLRLLPLLRPATS